MGTTEVKFSGAEQAKLVADLKTRLGSICNSLDASANMLEKREGNSKYWKDTCYGIRDISNAFRNPFDKESFTRNVLTGLEKVEKAIRMRYYGAFEYVATDRDMIIYAELLTVSSTIKDGQDLIWSALPPGSGSPNRTLLHPDMPSKDLMMELYHLHKALGMEVASLVIDANIHPRDQVGYGEESRPGYYAHRKALEELMFERMHGSLLRVNKQQNEQEA